MTTQMATMVMITTPISSIAPPARIEKFTPVYEAAVISIKVVGSWESWHSHRCLHIYEQSIPTINSRRASGPALRRMGTRKADVPRQVHVDLQRRHEEQMEPGVHRPPRGCRPLRS